MNRDGALRPAPEDLGQAADIDSFAVEAGVILLERFCALDRVVRTAQGWSVPVTDLQRHIGHAPHHRLRMEFLRAGDGEERKLRRAVRLVTDVQPVVHGWIRSRDGILLLTDPVSGAPATSPLTDPESATVALALTAALSQLHGAGVTGVGFSPESLHVMGREVRVVGYEHLMVPGTAEEDVHRLADLLELLSGGALSPLLRPTPTTAVELWDRLRSSHEGTGAKRLPLPATPPFVGREQVLARLIEAGRRARSGQAQVVVVRGEPEMGRTRLLGRFEAEIDRWLDAVVLSASFKPGTSGTHSGLVGILETLAQHPSSLGSAEHEAIRDRIRNAAGPLLGLIAGLSPNLSRWLGDLDLPTNLTLDERFGQHAATVAATIRTIGTSRRPAIILLDDAHLADPGSAAALDELIAGPRRHHTLVVLTSNRVAEQRGGDCVVVDLEPLARNDIRDMIVRTVPGGVADIEDVTERLWQLTRGSPSLAWSRMQKWARDDTWTFDPTTNGWRLAADSSAAPLGDPHETFWHSLQPHQQWIVLIAALRAGRSSVRWLVSVSGWNETEVRNAVGVVVEAGMLVAEPDGGLRFASDNIRSMIERNVSDEVRSNAHRQIATWLEREPGTSAAQLAWHADLARPAGRDERLADLHVKGGQELLTIYDLTRARWHFDRALTRATAPAVWVDALEGRADVALLDGRTDEALDDYLQAMTYGGDEIRGLEIAAKAVQGFYRKSAEEAAHELARRALEIAHEPLPKTTFGLAWATFVAMFAIRLRSPAASTRVRDALCRLYTYLTVMMIAEHPLSGLLCVLRGVRHARGLDSQNAAAILSFYAALWSAAGGHRRATRILEEAEAVGRRAGQPWGLGVVDHMRAQDEMAAGKYDLGAQSFARAVDQFRLAGDLSVAVFSLTLRAVYCRENQPADAVIAWANEAEAFARRQGNNVGLLVPAALRAAILARRGDPKAADAARDAADRAKAVHKSSIELVNMDAYLALAFVYLGNANEGWEHARRAAKRLENGPAAADYLLDAHIAVAASVVSQPQPTAEQRKALKRALRALKSHGRRAPRLAAAWRLYSSRDAIAHGDLTTARTRLEELIETHPVHRQSGYALEGHRLLADLVRAADVALADRHLAQASALAVALGIEAQPVKAPTPTPAATTRITPAPVERLARTVERELPTVAVEPMVRRLLPAFERALPRGVSLKVEVAPDAQVRCNPESLQLLVVNLILAARDALRERGNIRVSIRPVKLDPVDSARLPGVNADAHLLVEARAAGYHGSETISGIGICSEITASIGGFVDVRQEPPDVLVIAAYLAASELVAVAAEERGRGPEAVVVHSDPRVRQTVVSALRDLGLRAEGIDPSLHRAAVTPDRLVFTEIADAAPGSNQIVLYPRGTPAPSGPSLRVPFTIGELQAVVETLHPPDSNGGGSPQ